MTLFFLNPYGKLFFYANEGILFVHKGPLKSAIFLFKFMHKKNNYAVTFYKNFPHKNFKNNTFSAEANTKNIFFTQLFKQFTKKNIFKSEIFLLKNFIEELIFICRQSILKNLNKTIFSFVKFSKEERKKILIKLKNSHEIRK